MQMKYIEKVSKVSRTHANIHNGKFLRKYLTTFSYDLSMWKVLNLITVLGNICYKWMKFLNKRKNKHLN